MFFIKKILCTQRLFTDLEVVSIDHPTILRHYIPTILSWNVPQNSTMSKVNLELEIREMYNQKAADVKKAKVHT